jgi:hypothetical protein
MWDTTELIGVFIGADMGTQGGARSVWRNPLGGIRSRETILDFAIIIVYNFEEEEVEGEKGKKMAGTNASSESGEQVRVGQLTLPAAELDALTGQELVTERHLGSPRPVGELETVCAMLAEIAAPHSLSPCDSTAVVHCSGAQIDTHPLQFASQFTNEPIGMSSAVYLSTNEPPLFRV